MDIRRRIQEDAKWQGKGGDSVEKISGGGRRERMRWPTFIQAFYILAIVRTAGALCVHITDCDETFNYWEPLHYLLYGNGFQTWEYSPQFAIRSYAYVLLHAVPAWLIKILSMDKVITFYFIRIILALFCAYTEAYYFSGICKAYDYRVGRCTLLFLLFGSGMYISAAAFLPSSFTMYLTMLAYGAFFKGNYSMFVFSIGLSAMWGWPFSGVLGVPGALYIIWFERKLAYFAKWTICWSLVLGVPLMIIDSYYYGKIVLAPLNIVLYNVFAGKGPELYGVEPWTFYFINGFLNFNVVFVLALVSLPLYLGIRSIRRYYYVVRGYETVSTLITMSTMYIWMLIFFTRPHKEERFLYPIYPLICCSSALVICEIEHFVEAFWKDTKSFARTVLRFSVVSIFSIFVALSMSRSMALYTGYHAPMEIYRQLPTVVSESKMLSRQQNVNICVGKEWYRFPSSFFLPARCELRFIKSEFRGQLPKPYPLGTLATRLIPDNMNDMNKEEPSRYTKIQDCHILVDQETLHATDFEPSYSKDEANWKSIIYYPFLDSVRSHRLWRAFYVPYISSWHVRFNNYGVLLSVNHSKLMFTTGG